MFSFLSFQESILSLARLKKIIDTTHAHLHLLHAPTYSNAEAIVKHRIKNLTFLVKIILNKKINSITSWMCDKRKVNVSDVVENE